MALVNLNNLLNQLKTQTAQAGATVYNATGATTAPNYGANNNFAFDLTSFYQDDYDNRNAYGTDEQVAFYLQQNGGTYIDENGEEVRLFDRRIMDNANRLDELQAKDSAWRVDVIKEDANGDGVLDEKDAEKMELVDAIVDSFDSELDLYIEAKVQEIVEKYGSTSVYNLKAIFGDPNSPANIELARLGIRADAVGDHECWQNRTYTFSLVDMSGLPEDATDEEILAHVYDEKAEILEDANGKKGSIIFADCLTADGTAQGAELNLSSILDMMGYDLVSKADYVGKEQEYGDLLKNIKSGLDNNLYQSSGQTINDKYGRTLTMAQAVCAVYKINGDAPGYWQLEGRTFEQTANWVEKMGDRAYEGGGYATKGQRIDYGTTDVMPAHSNYSELSEASDEADDLNLTLEERKETEEKAEENEEKIEKEAEKSSAEQYSQIIEQQEQQFNEAVKSAQALIDDLEFIGEYEYEVEEIIENMAVAYGIDRNELEKELKY